MKKLRRKRKPYGKNISPSGWYVTSILIRFEFNDEVINNLNRHCLAWENQILIKAKSPEEAYIKALALGKLEEQDAKMWNDKGRKGRWRFEGLTSLLPIYAELEDGAEIAWKEYSNKIVKKIKSLVKTKQDLAVFIDY